MPVDLASRHALGEERVSSSSSFIILFVNQHFLCLAARLHHIQALCQPAGKVAALAHQPAAEGVHLRQALVAHAADGLHRCHASRQLRGLDDFGDVLPISGGLEVLLRSYGHIELPTAEGPLLICVV